MFTLRHSYGFPARHGRHARTVSPGNRAAAVSPSSIGCVAGALAFALVLGGSASRSSAFVLTGPVVTDSAGPFSPAFAASNTVDDTELEYASAGQGIDTYLVYSFGSPQTFDKIVVINRDSGGASDWIGNFTLTFDGGATASVARTGLRGSSEIHSLGAPRTATTVRLDVDTLGGNDNFNNTGAMEVLFVRTPLGQSPVAATILNSSPAFAPLYAVNNAVDGLVGRTTDGAATDGPEYASMGQGTNTFVDFDLGARRPVGGFDFFDRPADEDRVTAFDMIFSVNSTFGDADDVVKSYTNAAVPPNTPARMALGDIFPAVSAQYVRFDVTAAAGANTGISEMVFYEVPEPSAVGLCGVGLAVLGMRRRRARR